jgi:hypothetical protein
MTIRHSHPSFRALVAAAFVVSGIAFAALPVAASTATHATTPVCGPKISSHHPAPGVGKSATYTANSAGSVTLLQQTQTTLNVKSASPASGWKDTVVTASGTTVHVGFQVVKAPEEQERFWARLNSTGTTISIVIQSCT